MWNFCSGPCVTEQLTIHRLGHRGDGVADTAAGPVYVPYTQTDWPFVQVVARLDLPAATVVPEVRWLKNPDMLRFFLTETTEHYQDHGDDLTEILSATRRDEA